MHEIFFYFKLGGGEYYYLFLNKFKKITNDKNYIYLLISISPTTRMEKIVGIIKQNIVKKLKKFFNYIKKYSGKQN